MTNLVYLSSKDNNYITSLLQIGQEPDELISHLVHLFTLVHGLSKHVSLSIDVLLVPPPALDPHVLQHLLGLLNVPLSRHL